MKPTQKSKENDEVIDAINDVVAQINELDRFMNSQEEKSALTTAEKYETLFKATKKVKELGNQRLKSINMNNKRISENDPNQILDAINDVLSQLAQLNQCVKDNKPQAIGEKAKKLFYLLDQKEQDAFGQSISEYHATKKLSNNLVKTLNSAGYTLT